MPLGACLAVPLAGPAMERWGRRVALLASSAPMLAGWIAIACSSSLAPLYTGRVLTGLAACCYSTVVPVYIGSSTNIDR